MMNFIQTVESFNLPKQEHLFAEDLSNKTIVKQANIGDITIKQYINEFWTAKQRQGSSVHEISYRACFKPQLPSFFIQRLSKKGDYIYDPFLGRGTTVIEAALLGRNVIGNDINPLSRLLTKPRLNIPNLEQVKQSLAKISMDYSLKGDIDLSMFYHKKTESEIESFKRYFLKKEINNSLNSVDNWIRMVATNRLTGHSKGFFSVYTMPPNQAVSAKRQIKINTTREQIPSYRNTKELIIQKTKSLIKNITPMEKCNLYEASNTSNFFSVDATQKNSRIASNSVQLTVTSPPFLDVVQYAQDNWLRFWFNGIDSQSVDKGITMASTIEKWSAVMQNVLYELYRITKSHGYVAFEVGDVKNGKIKLDEYIIPLGIKAKFKVIAVMINTQQFTKTANIWGIKNNSKGTNSNKIIVFQKK